MSDRQWILIKSRNNVAAPSAEAVAAAGDSARANLDAAAAHLAAEIDRRIAGADRRAKALAALALVVEITAEVMMDATPDGGVH